MKYRIKKETYTDIEGKARDIYYPQHKHWWCPWWHNFGTFDAYSDYEHFETFNEAKRYIDWFKSKHYKEEYYY